MKTFIALFLLTVSQLSLALTPEGVFKVDSTKSKVMKGTEDRPLTGLIEFNQDFVQSIFRFETSEGVFLSKLISGTIDNFEVTGTIEKDGVSKEVTLKGKFYGVIMHDESSEKVVLKLESEKCQTSVVAEKPIFAVSELHKKVRDIVR